MEFSEEAEVNHMNDGRVKTDSIPTMDIACIPTDIPRISFFDSKVQMSLRKLYQMNNNSMEGALCCR